MTTRNHSRSDSRLTEKRQESPSPLVIATRYAASGWPVFPCWPGRKRPLTAHGFKDATTDTNQIVEWWTECPTANIGIATGSPGPDVLDVDVKPAGSGWTAFRRATRARLLTGAHMLVETPSGGLHVYFTGSEQGCGSLPGHFIDFRSRGGYVVAPPSVVDGRPYTVFQRRDTGGPVDFAAIRRLLDPPRRAAPSRPVTRARRIGGLIRKVADAGEGNRNKTLYWAACRAVEEGHTDLTELVDAAVSAGLTEREARQTVHSAQGRAGV